MSEWMLWTDCSVALLGDENKEREHISPAVLIWYGTQILGCAEAELDCTVWKSKTVSLTET